MGNLGSKKKPLSSAKFNPTLPRFFLLQLKYELIIRIYANPPPASSVQINCDGFVTDNSKAATSFIIRDTQGLSMLAGVANIGSIDILVTKAIAFCDGLTQAIAFRYKYVQVEDDSKILSFVVSMTYLIPLGD